MKISATRQKKRARIEVIPLIDIMFFLLATFVLVSFSMTENRGLLVALPNSKTNESKESKADTSNPEAPLQITVSILEDGSFALDKELMPFEILETKLRNLTVSNSNQKFLTLMGDKNSNLQSTVRILDLARELKIDSVTIRTVTGNTQI
ncbi:MAG TPA: biopolymer transporter ExbD [Oligoflexia bacterium]|nr:biopolymer transporter ExbD [Oligoflexia bacterium]HMP48220.1 biopolymer transporter ExbD [Oligoflexia bacterium]